MKQSEKMKSIALILFVSLLVGSGLLLQNSKNGPGKVSAEVPASVVQAIDRQKIKVNISGAVKQAGLYTVMPGKRIADIIDEAGGLLPEADKEKINLARVCSDGMNIKIPYKKVNTKNRQANKNKAKLGSRIININSADKNQLILLSGIGPSTADKIIEYRNKCGGFVSVEQLKDVPGIGEAKFQAIKGNISI